MTGNSRPVYSRQTTSSEQLPALVRKHLRTQYKKPLHAFSESLFEQLHEVKEQSGMPVILDSGCGNGNSTEQLARVFPDRLVIGIDKSRHRLSRQLGDNLFYRKDNLVLVRADVVDSWRQIAAADWNVEKHFLLYPNPWPRPDQIKRRWHGHPVFAALIAITDRIELRSNWHVYINEFKLALAIAGIAATVNTIKPDLYISPFEKKYSTSQHTLLQLLTRP